ncbi:efflux RND transporter periplasmic adaptor subunit [Bremerella sp. P1]|uniref:efflux RND transporter periplasmic adaptor subunit n=1 Tax=Bremerella sp. P1 TaxID=3026424 RepID=UPI002367D50B|nr:efflux RND transporter periplasmic adaptor subunit [Bremerella sp. P1]WDI43850.1 efflux RND transporter periplasmic adaptor subunit [Bremerella sp. P1]
MKRNVLRVTITLALTLFIAIGCGRRRQMPKVEPPDVTVAPAIKRQVVDFSEYTGHIEAVSSVDVYAKVSGYLQKVAFEDGAVVKEGDLLFEIDKRTYQAEYDQAVSQKKLYVAKNELAQATLARNKKLVGSGAVSQELFDESVAAANEAAAQVDAADSEIAARKVDLEYCTIDAAISGRIDRTYVTDGNLIQSGVGAPTLLTTIVSVDPIYAYFDVDELALLSYIQRHDSESSLKKDGSLRDLKIPVQIYLADDSEYPHLGTIDFGSNQVNAGSGTLTVRAVIPNPEAVLRPGLFVRVKVAAKAPYDAVLVPESAIGADQSDRYVYILDEEGNAERRSVQLGTKQGSLRVIKEGLAEGEKVIVNGLLLVRPGKPVKPQDTTMPEPPPIDDTILRSASGNKDPMSNPAPQQPSNPSNQPPAPMPGGS